MIQNRDALAPQANDGLLGIDPRPGQIASGSMTVHEA
jgi:hypothetical protein